MTRNKEPWIGQAVPRVEDAALLSGNARYFDDLSIKEISGKLNQPVNTIKIKIFRAKKLLIEKIKNND